MNYLLFLLFSISACAPKNNGMTSTTNNIQNHKSDSTSLLYLIKEPQNTPGKGKAIILLHGVGSNENDLFGLASQLPKDYFIIAPRGKFEIGAGSYAWYNVDFATGKPVINAEQERASRSELIRFVKEVKQKYFLDDIYIGGFSQGAIMSYTIGLTEPDDIKGVIAIGGRVLDEIRAVITPSSNLVKLKVFVAHGVQDNTLPIHFAREAKQYLSTLQVQLSYHEYQMSHEINQAVLEDINAWLTIN